MINYLNFNLVKISFNSMILLKGYDFLKIELIMAQRKFYEKSCVKLCLKISRSKERDISMKNYIDNEMRVNREQILLNFISKIQCSM